MTIKMDKGTGIVTSVPSDSPDDYAAYMDLMKDGKRDYLKVKKEWIAPFELVPIINVEIDGEMRAMSAQYMCEKLGVASQNDKVKLLEAHDTCYKLGFDKGTMSAGPFKGMAVKKAKFEFRAQMVKDNQAFIYHEPEKKVVSRTGDECVVAYIDQWFLKYGDAAWRKQIEDHLVSSNWHSYNDRIRDSFGDAIGWLKEWACSRSFGLGTRVPWDEQFLSSLCQTAPSTWLTTQLRTFSRAVPLRVCSMDPKEVPRKLSQRI
jgi:leucyl-tRNA synthetase